MVCIVMRKYEAGPTVSNLPINYMNTLGPAFIPNNALGYVNPMMKTSLINFVLLKTALNDKACQNSGFVIVPKYAHLLLCPTHCTASKKTQRPGKSMFKIHTAHSIRASRIYFESLLCRKLPVSLLQKTTVF